MNAIYSPLFFIERIETEWTEYIGIRDVITWSAARFPSNNAFVEIQQVGQEFWGGAYPETHKAMSVGDVELNYIRKLFRELDKVLAPSFVETSPGDADITLMALSPDKDTEDAGWQTDKSPYPSDTERGVKFGTATWYDTTGPEYMDEWEMSTVVHEIGHALRLAHPGGLGGASGGWNKDFDVDDTIMSYNDAPEYGATWPLFFRELDIKALQAIWGAESNPAVPEWPATEKFPNIIRQLPYSPPKVKNQVKMIDNTKVKEEKTDQRC